MDAEGVSPTRSPLKRKLTFSSNSQIASPTKSKNINQIERLLNKFRFIDNSIEIDPKNINFNLIHYQVNNDKLKNDAKMMAMKLKRLENDAEIKRAQMQIDERLNRVKKNKIVVKVDETENYKQMYNRFKNDMNVFNSADDESDNQSSYNQKGPEGIRFYSSLKRHPRILQYTKSKLQQKSREAEERRQRTKQKIQSIKNPQNSQTLNQFIQLKKQHKLTPISQELTPDQITQKSKYFSKKSGQLRNDVRDKIRCIKILEKQNSILSQIEEASISKQNKKRLQGRLNQIVNEIAKSQKKIQENKAHSLKTFLPKINN